MACRICPQNIFMFCAFEGAPKILRLYGTGRTILPNLPEYEELFPLFTDLLGARQIILADIQRVFTSCGYGVPLYDFQGERDTWERWAEVKGEDGLIAYRKEKNSASIDGLPTPLCESP